MALSFHVRHEVTPRRCYEVITRLRQQEALDDVTQAPRQVARLKQLNLVDDKITPRGLDILNLCQERKVLWGDLLHFFHYTLWTRVTPEKNAYSWTYRTFTEHLWQMRAVDLQDHFWQAVVSHISGQIETGPVFEHKIATETKDGLISLSKNSLIGILHWLEALTPPVLADHYFIRRHFCPPELALLASGWVAQETEGELKIDFLLTPPRREAICRLCLLEPNRLDRVLDWVLSNYPEVVEAGTKAGIYGRYIRFLKWPEVKDLS